MNEEIKPCPCGNELKIKHYEKTGYIVFCQECFMQFPALGARLPDKNNLIKEYNKNYRMYIANIRQGEKEVFDKVKEKVEENFTPLNIGTIEQYKWWKKNRGSDSFEYNDGYDDALGQTIEEIEKLKEKNMSKNTSTVKINDKEVKIDKDFQLLIKELNRVGLRTTHCCSGHGAKDKYISIALDKETDCWIRNIKDELSLVIRWNRERELYKNSNDK